MANDVATTNNGFSRIGSNLGTSLTLFLMSDDIEPGSVPSYQICKIIYTLHPIGKKMVDAPIKKAQSQDRLISIPDSPEEAVREQFEKVWLTLGSERLIGNAFRISRIYGISTLAAMIKGLKPTDPIDYISLYKAYERGELTFNVLDPLNTAGSMVLSQDPNAFDFLKVQGVSIAGVPYNMSRVVVTMNEDPIYIDYTSSSFGYVGRSVYQRALLPLKSFLQSMIADDLVTIKAGVLIAKIKPAGAIATQISILFNGLKRMIVKEARTNNVISITPDEAIESLDLTNIPDALDGARKHILENIAVANDMPAVILNSETFAEGFADGTEDAKIVIEYINGVRKEMDHLYSYFTKITQYCAWTPDFYKTIQKRFPEDWGSVKYEEAFYRWVNSFTAVWPSLMIEPESELIKKEAVKLESLIAQTQVLLQIMDPANKVKLIEYMIDNFNALKLLFPNPLVIDPDALLEYLEEQQNQQKDMHKKTMESEGPSPNRKFGDDDGEDDPPWQRGIQMRDKLLALAPPTGRVRGKVRERATAQ